MSYGVATISRLLKFTGLFCKTALYKRLYSAEETYNFKEPTNRSHPICQKGAIQMRNVSHVNDSRAMWSAFVRGRRVACRMCDMIMSRMIWGGYD